MRITATLLDSISLLLLRNHLQLWCFASLDALVPRVLKFCAYTCATISKPRPTTCTATAFARSLDGPACKAGRIDGRQPGRFSLHARNND